MSSYKELTNTPLFNLPGESRWDTKTLSYDWINLDGQIVLQSAYPRLFTEYGFIKNTSLTEQPISNTQTGLINKLNAIEYGNNVVIIGGEGGSLATSADGGTTWSLRDSGTVQGINEILYANNIYVYVANSGVLATSTDLVTWTARTSGTSNNINSIAYGNNTFVYVGDSGTLATSPNAVTWTTRTSGTTVDITDIAYGNGKFVYVGEGGVSATSQNTITWQSTSTNTLQYVGGKTMSRIDASGANTVSLTDLTGGLSTAPQPGDIVIVAVNTGATVSVIPVVSGYTLIHQQNVADAYDANFFVGYKIMGAVPDTTITFPAGGSTSDSQTAAIQVWRNYHPDIFDVTTTTFASTNTIVPNPPSITPVSSNTVLLVIAGGSHAAGTQTYTASYLSNFLTVGANDTNDSTIGFGSISRPSPGAYDPAAWTFSGTDSTAYSYVSVTIALKPKTTNINAITYGQNKFVYVGERGTYATSNDNIISFTTSDANTAGFNVFSVFYSSEENQFIWGSNGRIGLSSTGDSESWTRRTPTYSEPISDITYGQKVYFFTYSDTADRKGWASYLSEYTYDTYTEFKLPSVTAFPLVANTSQTGINNDIYIRGG